MILNQLERLAVLEVLVSAYAPRSESVEMNDKLAIIRRVRVPSKTPGLQYHHNMKFEFLFEDGDDIVGKVTGLRCLSVSMIDPQLSSLVAALIGEEDFGDFAKECIKFNGFTVIFGGRTGLVDCCKQVGEATKFAARNLDRTMIVILGEELRQKAIERFDFGPCQENFRITQEMIEAEKNGNPNIG